MPPPSFIVTSSPGLTRLSFNLRVDFNGLAFALVTLAAVSMGCPTTPHRSSGDEVGSDPCVHKYDDGACDSECHKPDPDCFDVADDESSTAMATMVEGRAEGSGVDDRATQNTLSRSSAETTCTPNATICIDDVRHLCDPQTLEYVETPCPSSTLCTAGGECMSQCEIAEQQFSSVGCRFVAAVTPNTGLDSEFFADFAVVIGNPSTTQSAHIIIRQHDEVIANSVVEPSTSKPFILDATEQFNEYWDSHLYAGGAYQISSDLPVSAYQFNPLHFALDDVEPLVFSYSNDASLLLPEHVLTGHYMVSSAPTFRVTPFWDWQDGASGFFTIVGLEDNTTVTITSSGKLLDLFHAPIYQDDVYTVTIQRGDVLTIEGQMEDAFLDDSDLECFALDLEFSSIEGVCVAAETDPTGTRIDVDDDKKVAVFAGHGCTSVPLGHLACDHLESMLMPTETWGSRALLSAPIKATQDGRDLAVYRILALDDNTEIEFDPPLWPPTTIHEGEPLEVVSDEDFWVRSINDKQLIVQQIFVGAFAPDEEEPTLGEDFGPGEYGDPAMGLSTPAFQFRADYVFFTPETFSSNWLNIAAPVDAEILLDDLPVELTDAVGESGWAVARIEVQPGSHRIKSTGGDKFAITAYGYAPFTSYLFAGGLNVGKY